MSTPINCLLFILTSLILSGGSVTSTGLHTGVQPFLPFVPGPQKRRRASRSARSSRSTGTARSRRRPIFLQEDANNMQAGTRASGAVLLEWVPALRCTAKRRCTASGEHAPLAGLPAFCIDGLESETEHR